MRELLPVLTPPAAISSSRAVAAEAIPGSRPSSAGGEDSAKSVHDDITFGIT